MEKKVRYYLIDSIRGLAIVNMVLYHLLYDMVYMFGFDMPFFRSEGAFIWERIVCSAFILLSGMCWHFSRNSLKRGFVVFLLGWAITLVTAIAVPAFAIWHGVLNLLGLSMMLMVPLNKLLCKINAGVGIFISLLLFFLTANVPNHYIGFGDIKLLTLPDFLYSNDLLAFLGFKSAGFSSTDYFPLLPWFFMFCTGYFLWRIIKTVKIEKIFTVKVPVLDVVGRHSLVIYIVHQPVIYGLLYVFCNIF